MKYAFLSCALLAATIVTAQRNTVVLQGTAKNFNNQVEVQDMSETGDLSLPDPKRFFIPNETGHFYVKFNLSAPNYFRIGRNILYLSPGDSLGMTIDYKDPRAATFTGTHAKENEYLRETPFPKGGSFLNAGQMLRKTIDSTATVIEGIAKERQRSLDAYTGLSKEFVRLETARIRADIINSLYAIKPYAGFKWKLPKDSAETFDKNFPALIAPYVNRHNKNFIDASLLKLVVYRDVIDDLLENEKTQTAQCKKINDWKGAAQLAQQLKSASDRATKKQLEPKIAKVLDATYRNALLSTLNKVMQLSNGDAAYDFLAKNISGEKASLGDLKGKLIYIDLWATWCGPCMEEMPSFEKLKESFKDNPNISFISLSIDDDALAWQASVKKRGAQGLQWLVDRAKLQPYNVVSIPRTIIVDKDFKIVEMNAPLPSSKTLVAKLNELMR